MKTIQLVILAIFIFVGPIIFNGCEKAAESVQPPSYEAPSVHINAVGYLVIGDTIQVPRGQWIGYTMTAVNVNGGYQWWFFDVTTVTINTKDADYAFNVDGLYRIVAKGTGPGGTAWDTTYARVGNFVSGGEQVPFKLNAGAINTINGTMNLNFDLGHSYMPSDTTAPFLSVNTGEFIAYTIPWSMNGYHRVPIQTYDSTYEFTYGGRHDGGPTNWNYANVTSSIYYRSAPYSKMVATIMNNQAYVLGAMSLWNPSPNGDTTKYWTVKWTTNGDSVILFLNMKRVLNVPYNNPHVKTSLNGFITQNAKMVGTTGVARLAFLYSALPTPNHEIYIKFDRDEIQADYSMSRYRVSDPSYGDCLKMRFEGLGDGPIKVIYEVQQPEQKIILTSK